MIGIIGVGNMGKSIAQRINEKILVSDISRARLRAVSSRRILVAKDNIDLARRSNIIILAVKPQHIMHVLEELTPLLKNKLIISIAAGVETALIEKVLGKVKVIRVMPNIPLIVGKGISAIARGRFAGKKDAGIAHRIFSKLGEVVEVKESLMDAVTALSGSGPAYYFLLTELLEKAGVSIGLEKALARKLAIATFIGAAECARLAGISMEEFVKKVASKGGTTEAALKVFKQREFEKIVGQAVSSAARRSCQLAKKLDT